VAFCGEEVEDLFFCLCGQPILIINQTLLAPLVSRVFLGVLAFLIAQAPLLQVHFDVFEFLFSVEGEDDFYLLKEEEDGYILQALVIQLVRRLFLEEVEEEGHFSLEVEVREAFMVLDTLVQGNDELLFLKEVEEYGLSL
jgi:hypothetical protein